VADGAPTEVYVQDKFPGFRSPGGVSDPGAYYDPFRSRGFQIDREGKLVKSFGYSQVAQVFDDTGSLVPTQYHGIHYWSGSGGLSTLVLCGSFGTLRSHQYCVTPGTTPYLLRFEALLMLGPPWNAQPSADPGADTGAAFLLGSFAEFGDNLYFANGLDWPIRIEGLHTLFAKPSIKPAYYRAMGVYHPTLNDGACIVMGLSKYSGKYSYGGGTNVTSHGVYVASVVSRFGEGPPVVLGTPVDSLAKVEKGFPIFSVVWAFFDEHITAVRLYRTPNASATPQFVADILRPVTSFLDTVPDTDLGYTIPYDTGLPCHFRILVAHQDRMWGIGGYGRPNRVACSKAGYPDVWPATFEIPLSADLGVRTIQQARVVNGELYLFLDRGILRLAGSSPENYVFVVHNDYVGCVAPRTLFPWRDGVVFLSRDGLYFFNGSSPQPIPSTPLSGVGWDSLGSIDWRFACGAVSHDRYYLSYRDDTGQKYVYGGTDPVAGYQPNRTLVIQLETGLVGVIDDWAFSMSAPYGQVEAIVLGFEV
jgi:hypothetical protein